MTSAQIAAAIVLTVLALLLAAALWKGNRMLLANLRAALAVLTTNVPALKEENASLRVDIDVLNSALDSARASRDAANARVAELEAERVDLTDIEESVSKLAALFDVPAPVVEEPAPVEPAPVPEEEQDNAVEVPTPASNGVVIQLDAPGAA